ncbi:MAG: ComF family protein [Cyclobacteriaceae bacterium]|jgi:ComF family protein|nr:ComF family protein [Cyclobacteriaceae bacterium]
MNLLKDFVSLFFPRYCLACSNSLVGGEETLCTYCIVHLPKTNYELGDNPVRDRLAGRLPITYGVAFLKLKKGGVVQKMLHQLKYKHHPEIGVKLGKVFGNELKQKGLSATFDLIIPVPLHPSRIRKRGYNQSAKFAEGLSYVLQVPWDESISVRKTRTKTQTNKSKLERWENVKDVFAIAQSGQVSGKRILLVDDVITTGATLEACGMHLINSGCAQLSVACIAEAQ